MTELRYVTSGSSFDWRQSPKGTRLHAAHGFVAFCGSPVAGRWDGRLRDKCATCLRIVHENLTRWPK